MRTLMFIDAVPGDDAGGVRFVAYATRFERYMNVGMDELRSWLPCNTVECDVRRWSGSSPDERESAQGLEGLFHATDEVDDFVARLSAALADRPDPMGENLRESPQPRAPAQHQLHPNGNLRK